MSKKKQAIQAKSSQNKLACGRVDLFDCGMHTYGLGQGLPQQDITMFHVGEASGGTKAICDSFIGTKIENLMV